MVNPEIRRLQYLNDLIAQTLDALTQRSILGVGGLSHTGFGTEVGAVNPLQAASLFGPFAGMVSPLAHAGLMHSPAALYGQVPFVNPLVAAQLYGQVPAYQGIGAIGPTGAGLFGTPAVTSGLGHTPFTGVPSAAYGMGINPWTQAAQQARIGSVAPFGW